MPPSASHPCPAPCVPPAGDFWDQGVMLRYLRSREVQVSWDEVSKQYVLPYEAFNKVFQVRTELQLIDPNEW